MSTAIYQIAIGKNNISANVAMKTIPEAEREAVEAQMMASLDELGVTRILSCNSAWADEEHPWWVVLRFPSLEARMEHVRITKKIGWLDMVDAFTLLGTSTDEFHEVTYPDAIYKLWLLRTNPAGALTNDSRPKGLTDLMWEKHDAVYKENNSQVMLFCNSYWCNEAYPAFGVSAYPNIEANMRVMETLDGLGWRRNLDCFSLLGTSA